MQEMSDTEAVKQAIRLGLKQLRSQQWLYVEKAEGEVSIPRKMAQNWSLLKTASIQLECKRQTCGTEELQNGCNKYIFNKTLCYKSCR